MAFVKFIWYSHPVPDLMKQRFSQFMVLEKADG